MLRRSKMNGTSLEARMILHRFMCRQFGFSSLRDMLTKLQELSHQLGDGLNNSLDQTILMYLQKGGIEHKDIVRYADFVRYSTNISEHSRSLHMTGDDERSWKPFQYIALLFTEHYLDMYFQDSDALVRKLNEWKQHEEIYDGIQNYTVDDVRTLAFQSATGSGKTLLLHANILQYQHYLKEHEKSRELNKIILVTPHEGLSLQHLRELESSRIMARLFSDDEEPDLFSRRGAVVEIVDLHKLSEKKGVKTISLEAFEENNLVLVDEGHLGVSGNKWRSFRKRLARNGFTFEYSATFNQAVSGGGNERRKLRDEYGKSILFDYSYKFFYEDGFGKDYRIFNLRQTDDEETNRLYLLACLLTFYQQCAIYRDKGGQWSDFNIARPLWAFLGKTVTGGSSVASKETETDVLRIIKFLAWVQDGKAEVVKLIARLIGDHTGLVDESRKDVFHASFVYLGKMTPEEIYDDLRGIVFHGKGKLHVSYVGGADEIQLSAEGWHPFGVINVGDAPGLYRKLDSMENPLFSLSRNAFGEKLFPSVDNEGSMVNIVVGAQRFAAGWNSWRVSTMGLLHVGTGEGPQIIQMFGRGVRLKGYDMSLKRHTELAGIRVEDGDLLRLLETLNIFGLKANYMNKFKEYLQADGVMVDPKVFVLSTIKRFGKERGLKIIKKRETVGKFEHAAQQFELSAEPKQEFVKLDRYKHLQVLDSKNSGVDEGKKESETRSCRFSEIHLNLINRKTIFRKVLERKFRFRWHNMTISQEVINALLKNPAWYVIEISPEKLEFSHYGRVREWENMATDLICEYADQFWRRKRNAWEHKHVEALTLDGNDPNYVPEYEFSVDSREERLIREVEEMVKRANAGNYDRTSSISLLIPDFHAYVPLLHASEKNAVQVTPTPLNDGEADFVKCLKDVTEDVQPDVLKGKEIYLMRNLSHGRGMSFFSDYFYYPDFILWVRDSDRQDILFVDPKGLAHFDHKKRSKVDLHHRIKETEEKIRRGHPEIRLHAYIWSRTEPQNIGTDQPMDVDECHKQGIFIASGKEEELVKLLQHALQ